LEFSLQRNRLGKDLDGAGVLSELDRIAARDEEEGLLACARAFVGSPVEQVEALAKEWFETQLLPRLYPPVRQLVEFLHERGMRVFLISSSYEQALFPAAEALGIPRKRVIGIRFQEVDGRVSELRVGPLPFRAAKARELHEHTGIPPVLVVGSSADHRELLEAAIHLSLVINPSTEQRRDGAPSLATTAARHDWPILHL
jgi:phosphoserine phosphatase